MSSVENLTFPLWKPEGWNVFGNVAIDRKGGGKDLPPIEEGKEKD